MLHIFVRTIILYPVSQLINVAQYMSAQHKISIHAGWVFLVCALVKTLQNVVASSCI
jgi:hypothetical protein